MSIILECLEEVPATSCWISCSFRDEERLNSGDHLADFANLLRNHPQVHAIGVNCTPPVYVESIIRKLKPLSTQPIIAYPNSGEKWDSANHCWLEQEDPEDFTNYAEKWYLAGARIIGGCCRIGPNKISALKSHFTKIPQNQNIIL